MLVARQKQALSLKEQKSNWKGDTMEIIKIKSEKDKVRKVKELILSTGNKIGSVHFYKRADGEYRKMCYRLHTRFPSYATKPSGKRLQNRIARDSDNKMITVIDTNAVIRNKNGKISGRGAWRTIPLENVVRVCVNGTIYRIRKQ